MLTTPQAIINRARRLGYISSGQYTDAVALEDFNIIHKELVTIIQTDVDEDYFSDFINTLFIDGQNEYYLQDDTNEVNVKAVQDVFVRYNASDEYIKCKEVDKNSLPNELATYNDTQDKANPFYFIFDDSVFVYPAPDANVSDGLRVYASLTPWDLAIDSTNVLLPVEKRQDLVTGMLPYIYQARGLINEKNDAVRAYLDVKDNIVIDLSNRTSTPQEVETPNLDFLA